MAKNILYQLENGGICLRLPVGSTIVSGDPVEIVSLHGVAETSYDAADGKAMVRMPGITDVADLPVNAIDGSGNSAIAIGDKLYYVSGDTPKISKKTSGKLIGYALETVVAGSTDTINVALVQS